MLNTFIPPSRRGLARRGVVVATALAAVSLSAAACGGSSDNGTTASSPTSGSTGNSSGSASLPSGTPGKGKPTIKLGDKNFPEAFLVGDLYQQALKAKGFDVDLKANIGGSEIIDTAFKSGKIDIYPEYTGEIVASVAHDTSKMSSAQETWQKAKAFEEKSRDATLLPQTAFQDVDVVIVKPDFAKKYGLKSIGDLNKVGAHGKGVSWASQPPEKTRYAGMVGLKKAYGLTKAKFVGVDVGVTYKALDSGRVNSADAFSTDGQLTTGKYVALKDPKHIMGFQHVAPVVKKSLLSKEGPAFSQTLNWVNSLLTQKAILQMNAAIQLHHQDPAQVAKKFLSANGLS